MNPIAGFTVLKNGTWASYALDMKTWNPYRSQNNLLLTITGHETASWIVPIVPLSSDVLVACSRDEEDEQECVLRVWNPSDRPTRRLTPNGNMVSVTLTTIRRRLTTRSKCGGSRTWVFCSPSKLAVPREWARWDGTLLVIGTIKLRPINVEVTRKLICWFSKKIFRQSIAVLDSLASSLTLVQTPISREHGTLGSQSQHFYSIIYFINFLNLSNKLVRLTFLRIKLTFFLIQDCLSLKNFRIFWKGSSSCFEKRRVCWRRRTWWALEQPRWRILWSNSVKFF